MSESSHGLDRYRWSFSRLFVVNMASLASSKARKIGNTVVPAIGFGAMRLAAINLGLEDADEERMKVRV